MGPEHHHTPESVLEYNTKKAGVDIVNWLMQDAGMCRILCITTTVRTVKPTLFKIMDCEIEIALKIQHS